LEAQTRGVPDVVRVCAERRMRMDTKTFDRLTVAWATERSRRGALGLLGGALAIVLAAVTPEAAEACSRRRRCGQRCLIRCCPRGSRCRRCRCRKG
jgi:hypothetical protein